MSPDFLMLPATPRSTPLTGRRTASHTATTRALGMVRVGAQVRDAHEPEAGDAHVHAPGIF